MVRVCPLGACPGKDAPGNKQIEAFPERGLGYGVILLPGPGTVWGVDEGKDLPDFQGASYSARSVSFAAPESSGSSFTICLNKIPVRIHHILRIVGAIRSYRFRIGVGEVPRYNMCNSWKKIPSFLPVSTTLYATGADL